MTLQEIFDALAGQRIPGGCDDCDAYQEVGDRFGIHVIDIYHDDTCPAWLQHHAPTDPKAAS